MVCIMMADGVVEGDLQTYTDRLTQAGVARYRVADLPGHPPGLEWATPLSQQPAMEKIKDCYTKGPFASYFVLEHKVVCPAALRAQRAGPSIFHLN